MKEKYTPIEPIKTGIKVTSIIASSVFETVKPRIKEKVARDVSALLEEF